MIKLLRVLLGLTYLGNISSYENSTRGLGIRSTNQPGMFFEQLSDIRFINRYWKLVILMDVRVPQMDFPTYRKYIEQVAAKSGPIGADVEFIHKLRAKVSKKFRQTTEYLDTLKMAKKGFVSTISIEDQKYYNNKVSSLELAKDGVMIDDIRKVLLVNSTLEKVCEPHVEKDRVLLGNLSKLLGINEVAGEVSAEEFQANFTTMTELFESRLDDYITSTQNVIQNLNFVTQNHKVLSTLLRKERFQYIIKLIEQASYPYLFPFDKNNASITILNEISTISYALRNGSYQVEINTGLVEPEHYPLFKIQPFSAPQTLAKEKAGFLYIQPQKPNIILSKRGHHLLHEEELLDCNMLNKTKICPMRQFLFTDENKCESDLLRRQHAINWTRCDVRIEKENSLKFAKPKLSNIWLFSTQGPVRILMRCNDTIEEGITIQGTGYLYATRVCMLRYGVSMLELVPDVLPSNIIIPEVDLMIQHLSEILEREMEQNLFHKLMMADTQDSFWQLERDLRKQMKNTKTQNNTGLIFYIFASLIIISIVITTTIVIFLCIFKRILAQTPETVSVRLIPIQNRDSDTYVRGMDLE